MTEREKKGAGGRPSSYRKEFAEQAKKLCELGATDFEIARFFDVHVATIYRWQATIPEFCEALRLGKDAVDERVERSLYHRAMGYTFESEKVFQFQGQIVRTPVTEHVPPDTTAAIFWLKNRRKDEWRDRRELEVGGPGDFARMNDAELDAFISERQGGSGAGAEGARAAGDPGQSGKRGRLN